MSGGAVAATRAGGSGGTSTRAGWQAGLTLLGALAASGVAWWLWPASLHIVSWTRGGPQRIAVLAPLARLWLGLGIAVSAGVVAWMSAPARMRTAAHVLAPLNLLWAWTVPFWPWLPDRLPLLVAGGGPLRLVIAALAAGAVVSRAVAAVMRRPSTDVARLVGEWLEDVDRRRARVTAFIGALAFYALLGVPAVATTGLGGDEPHYLVITQSLIADGDLKIENNHTNGEYRRFFNGPLRPDYLQRGTNGEIYSIHAPGLSALLLPGYLLGGGLGAVLTVILLAGLTALAVFDLARLVAPAGIAWLTWAVVVASVPMIPHAWALYPEIAGAVVVAWAMVWLVAAPPRSSLVWAWRGSVVAILPWLHTKFSVLLAGLAVLLAWRLRRDWRLAVAFFVPIAIIGAAWLGFFYVVYGRLDPQAPYGGYAAQFVRFGNLPRSLLGLFFDQKFGLLVYTPVYGLVGAGLVAAMSRREPRVVVAGAALLAAAYVISSARLYMWWGGSSAPARFMVPVVPLLVVPLAWGIERQRGRAAALAWAIAGVVSVALAVAGAIGARELLLFSVPHGVARIVDLLQGSAPLAAALPTFTSEDWLLPLGGLIPWLAAVVAALAAGKLAARRTASWTWIAAVELLVFAAIAVALHPSFAADVRAAAATRGAMALIEVYDPARARAFDYARGTRLTPPEWLARLRVTFDREAGGEADPQGRLTDALVLPAGVYDATVWFEGTDRPRAGVLQAALGNGYVLARREPPLTNPTTLPLALPVAVPSLWLQVSDANAARAVRRVELRARDVTPASARTADVVRAVEAFPDRLQAYVAYVNGDAYPEGGVFWTRADGRARLQLAPAGARTLSMTLHVGPQPTTVDVRVGDVVERVTMAADETRELRIPLPVGQANVAIEVQADRDFVPAEVDASSTDTRHLGCQVRLVLD